MDRHLADWVVGGGVALLAALPGAARAQDSLVYLVQPASRCEVQVGRAGIFGALGHDHLIRARACHGRLVYRPGSPAASHAELHVPAESLEVLTPPDTAERRKVGEVMRRDVLVVRRNPEIRFVSRAVTPEKNGFQIRGALTIAGETREVTAPVVVTTHGDTLRADGQLTVKQTDFGIKPVKAGAGTVRVADRVVITFAIVALVAR